jgi:hypothetical protein
MIGFDSTPLRVANKGAPEGDSVLQDRGCREETMGLVLDVYQLLMMGLSWEKSVCGVQALDKPPPRGRCLGQVHF